MGLKQHNNIYPTCDFDIKDTVWKMLALMLGALAFYFWMVAKLSAEQSLPPAEEKEEAAPATPPNEDQAEAPPEHHDTAGSSFADEQEQSDAWIMLGKFRELLSLAEVAKSQAQIYK